MEERLRLRLEKSLELSREAEKHLYPEVVESDRDQIATSAAQLAHEHHSALIELMTTSHFASAAALIRPIAEASACAFWITYCAQSERVANLASLTERHDIPNLDDMVKALASAKQFDFVGLKELRALATSQDPSWKRLHGLTHGGMVQLSRRTYPDTFSLAENCFHLMQADSFLLPGIAIGTVLFPTEDLSRFIREEYSNLGRELKETYGREDPGQWRELPQPPQW